MVIIRSYCRVMFTQLRCLDLLYFPFPHLGAFRVCRPLVAAARRMGVLSGRDSWRPSPRVLHKYIFSKDARCGRRMVRSVSFFGTVTALWSTDRPTKLCLSEAGGRKWARFREFGNGFHKVMEVCFWCLINLFGCVRTCVLPFDYLLILYVPALVIVVSNVSRLVVYSCFCELRSNLLVLRRLLFSGCSCLLWAASLCIGAKKTLWDLLQERLRNSVKLNISRRR